MQEYYSLATDGISSTSRAEFNAEIRLTEEQFYQRLRKRTLTIPVDFKNSNWSRVCLSSYNAYNFLKILGRYQRAFLVILINTNNYLKVWILFLSSTMFIVIDVKNIRIQYIYSVPNLIPSITCV